MIREGDTAAEPKRARRRRWRPRHTVLWVDDDPNLTAGVKRVLRRQSIRVIPAGDGMQGYWLALTRKPDAIITDLRMPRWRGEDLVDCLAENKQTAVIPKIVLTGYPGEADLDTLAAKGVSAVLEKPLDLAGLAQALCTMLE